MKKHKIRLTAFFAAAAMSLSILSGCAQQAPESAPSEGDSDTVALTEASVSEVPLSETSQTEATDPPPPVEMPEAAVTDVTADEAKGDYISSNTSFTLTSKEDMAADELSALIMLSPDIPFELERTKERTYVLRLSDPIPDNKILRLTVAGSRSWAFQTADIFRVIGTFPADKSDYVPMNSGIEMTFTSPVNINTAKDNFTLSPDAEGRFELHNNGRTLVFAPNEKLEANTVYTVKISKGLSAENGDSLTEDISFEFKTKSGDTSNYCYPSKGLSETFVPGDTVLTEFYASENVKKGKFDVKLYKYTSSEEYLAQMKQVAAETKSTFFEESGTVIPPADNMTLVFSDTVKSENNGSGGWSPSYIMLPDDLEEGYYLVNIRSKVGNFVMDRFIQINDISVYAAILPGSAAFFVNDASTGKAANGAKVSIADGGKTYACTIDSKGTGKTDIDNTEHGRSVMTVEFGGKTYIDFLPLREGWEKRLRDDYLVYVYTDREAYLTADTVNVWGTVFPRYQNVSLPKELTLAMHYYNADGESVPVTLNSDGTFTAKVPVSCAKDGWYDLDLCSGDEVLFSKYLRVEDYVKPAYMFNIDGEDVTFMAADNPYEVTLSASYYDGTAAPGLSFDISGADISSASTDSEGSITVAAKPEKREETEAYPSWEYVYFTMAGVENEYQSACFNYINIDRDVFVDYEQEGERINLTANLIDPDKVTKENRYRHEEYMGAPVDAAVTLTVEKSWTEKIEKGTYYDYLQKRTFKEYEYEYHHEDVGTYTAKTVNGKGVISGIEFDNKSSYSGKLSWTDTYGNRCCRNIYLKNPNRDYSYDRRDTGYKYYTLRASKNTFKENETLHFELNDHWESAAKASSADRIFYAFSQFDFLYTDVAEGISFDHKMTAGLIPNVNVCGAYFDGRHIFPLLSLDYSDYTYNEYGYYYSGLSFDPSERALSLSMTADKETYSPGDNVKITVKVTDISGKPAPGACVSLSVVDEAAFAIAPQNPYPLYTLYRDIALPLPTDYCSYHQYALDMNFGGEKGGGGDDDSVRRDFKDTAAFLTGTADSSGVAEFTFKSPDNITTWRATAHAVDNRPGGVYAGVSKEPVISTLPFFITPAARSVFVEGDDISFAAKTTAGNADITVTVKGNGVDETMTIPEISSAKFGKLPKGDYTVTFSAKSGSNSDAVELPFSVADTLLETEVVRQFDLTKDTFEISPLRYPVKLIFYDNEYTLYADTLCKLGSLWGDRADYELARAFAAKEFGYLTQEEYEGRFISFSSSSLISLWSYSEADPKITALIAAAEPTLTAGSSTAARFREILGDDSSTSEDVSCSYLGLAALGEPVLADLKRTVREPEGFDDTDMLRFAAAFGIMGDYDSGMKIFEDVCSRIMTGYNTADNAPALRTDSEYNDLAALMAASALNLDHAELLARHSVAHQQTEESCAPYLIFYLKNYTPVSRDEKEPAAVEITSGGKTETVTVNALGRTMRTLNKTQTEAEDFAVTLKNGSVSCLAYYEGRITDNLTPNDLTVTKKIESVTGGYAPGDMLKVTVNVSGFKGDDRSAAVDDVIPSGARFVKSGEGCYIKRNDMRISGYVSYNMQNRPMVYYIRLVTPGEYVVESAAARRGNELWGYSERGVLTVKEPETNA